jgi:glucosylceramidase
MNKNFKRIIVRDLRSSFVLKALVVLVVISLGVKLTFLTHADVPTYTAQFEAESGSVAGSAASYYDATASGGGYVQFGDLPKTGVGSNVVTSTVTTGDQTQLLSPGPNILLNSGNPTSSSIIHVSTASSYQYIDGFGAAMTDSSAINVNGLPTTAKNALMAKLFDPVNGIGISYLRLPLGASDFSGSNYTFDDMPAGQTDPTLAHFSISHDLTNIIPLLKQAKTLNPNLKIIAETWSAPAWMKSNDSLIGGTLNTSAYQAFAEYYVKTIQAYAAQGVTINAITPQNEPENNTSGYPGMTLTSAQETTFIGSYLAPALKSAGLTTEIIGYDHNWDDPSYPTTLLTDATAGPSISAIAWHCYAGTVDAQTGVHDQFPTKGTYMTECSGGDWSPDFTSNLNWDTTNLFIGAMRDWAQGVNLWNLALDTTDGPTNGGCTNCRGVVTINASSGTVTTYNIEYYVLGQAAKAISPGARRIDSDSTTNLESVAVVNTDGTYGLMVHNPTAAPETFSVVDPSSKYFNYTIPANAVVSFRW